MKAGAFWLTYSPPIPPAFILYVWAYLVHSRHLEQLTPHFFVHRTYGRMVFTQGITYTLLHSPLRQQKDGREARGITSACKPSSLWTCSQGQQKDGRAGGEMLVLRLLAV